MGSVCDSRFIRLRISRIIGDQGQAFGDGGSLGIITIAPTIKPRGGFFTRPELRAFATFAVWSDDLKGADWKSSLRRTKTTDLSLVSKLKHGFKRATRSTQSNSQISSSILSHLDYEIAFFSEQRVSNLFLLLFSPLSAGCCARRLHHHAARRQPGVVASKGRLPEPHANHRPAKGCLCQTAGQPAPSRSR